MNESVEVARVPRALHLRQGSPTGRAQEMYNHKRLSDSVRGLRGIAYEVYSLDMFLINQTIGRLTY